MNRYLLLLAFMVACSGRCGAKNAVYDEVEGTADCISDEHHAICITVRNELIECRVSGTFFHDAYCHLAGVVVRR